MSSGKIQHPGPLPASVPAQPPACASDWNLYDRRGVVRGVHRSYWGVYDKREAKQQDAAAPSAAKTRRRARAYAPTAQVQGRIDHDP